MASVATPILVLLFLLHGWCFARSSAGLEDGTGWHQSARDPEKVGKDLESVRILVVGKSGAGKSTLINRLFQLSNEHSQGRDSGLPVSASGKPGLQDINKEWKHPRDPVFIHDSNGVSTTGGTEVVADFLRKRMARPNHSDRVHLVWYVVSAYENRILDEANLLREVIRSLENYSVPILLVVTHCDGLPQDYHYFYNTNIARNLDAFLEGVEPETREAIKSNIVKVGNKGRGGGPLDSHKFAELAKKTRQYLGSEAQRQTWISAQKVDFELKLERSCETIRSFSSSLLQNLASYVKGKFSSGSGNFEEAFLALCSVWDVPLAFEDALREEFLFEDYDVPSAAGGSSSEFKAWLDSKEEEESDDSAYAMLVEAGKAAASMYYAGPIAAAGIIASHLSARVVKGAEGHSVEQANRMLMLAGAILYVKGTKDPGSSWAKRSREEYRHLIVTFIKKYSRAMTLLEQKKTMGLGVEYDAGSLLLDLVRKNPSEQIKKKVFESLGSFFDLTLRLQHDVHDEL